jgi:hypothetical protein
MRTNRSKSPDSGRAIVHAVFGHIAQAVFNRATVRSQLSEDADYRMFSDDRHQITIVDRDSGRVLTYSGATLTEAIQAARAGGVTQ